MSLPIPTGSVNAWIDLDEDEPSGTGYMSPNSSYQSLINNGVYSCVDNLFICFFTTVPDGNYWTLEIGNATTVHPGGLTTLQYMQNVIKDARTQNPKIKIFATLNYNTNTLSQIFSSNPSQWQDDVNNFAANTTAYLQANDIDGFDIDWEGAFSYAITTAQFKMLFTAIGQAFSGSLYLTMSPADNGNMDVPTVNTYFNFINLQLYGNGGIGQQFCQAGVNPNILGYGAKFESEYQTADEAYAGYEAGFIYNKVQYPYALVTQWRLNSDNYAYEQSQQILLYQFVNGIPSATFNDTSVIASAGNPPITELQINSGEVLDALEATNVTSGGAIYNLLQHGGNGGSPSTITLGAGDMITQITGYTGIWFGWNCVVQITISTKNGITYGPYGTMNNVTSKTPFNFTAPSGQSIVAFSGATIKVPEASGNESYVVGSLNVSYSG